MASVKYLAYQAADTAVAGASMNALANAGWAYGAEIDNSTLLYLYGDLTLALSSAVTAVAPAYINVYLLPNIDGNYTAASGDPSIGYLAATATGTAGSKQYIQARGILLTPNKFKIVIQNNLGVALPSTNTSVCSLYRYSEQVV